MTDASQPASPEAPAPDQLTTADGQVLAYHRSPGRSPGVVFLGGYASDMTGTKATALEAHVRARGHAFLRFDYRGHGQSSSQFEDGTIGRWRDDALAAIDTLTEGPQVLVGSSMGGWIALLVAVARPDRVAGLVGIAAAPDFTEDLMWAEFDEAQRAALAADRILRLPSEYSDEPSIVTMDLIEDGRNHLLLRAPVPIRVPVRLLQGMRDPDVPYRLALTLADRIEGDDVQVTLIKDGDHRLSTDRDLAILAAAVDGLLKG
ncbi:MAG: alpha/beta hydrolase [Thalassobaculum sp.]|uniref:alpha/beta hydrolase n=1 Tax=Thalassobaculum sp. TaxID=2022740 RepID=UPI0032F02FB0